MEKIDSIGREMVSDGSYKLSITGHSREQHLQLYLVRLLSTFLCVELIVLFHFRLTSYTHFHLNLISYIHTGFYVAASDRFVNVNQV